MIRRLLVTATLILMSKGLYATPEQIENTKIAKCEIKGTKPPDGGEKCFFYPNYVIVEKCNLRGVCRLPVEQVTENRFFKCPDITDPATPRWNVETGVNQDFFEKLKGLGMAMEVNDQLINGVKKTQARLYFWTTATKLAEFRPMLFTAASILTKSSSSISSSSIPDIVVFVTDAKSTEPSRAERFYKAGNSDTVSVQDAIQTCQPGATGVYTSPQSEPEVPTSPKDSKK